MTRLPVLALAPLGEVPTDLVAALAPILAAVLPVEAVLVDAVPLPAEAFHPGRGQYLSGVVLAALERTRRRDWHRLLGVTDVDLYVPRLAYVVGESDPSLGVAIVSFARLAPPEPAQAGRSLLLRRTAAEAMHELAHTWSLGHCPDRDCVMWFSRDVTETDRKGHSFCPAHLAQVDRALTAPAS